MREAFVERVNRQHYQTYAEDGGMHDLDRVVVRDCARVWRGLMHPRSERLASQSVLRALVDAARGRARGNLAPAFWAEVGHLIRGIDGGVRFHSGGATMMPSDATGRQAALLRSAELDLLGDLVDRWMRRYESGLGAEAVARRVARRRAVTVALGGAPRDWHDWHWQLRHIAGSGRALSRLAPLTEDEQGRIARAIAAKVPFAVTPYYASLFDEDPEEGRDRGIRHQVIPPADYVSAVCSDGGVCGAADFMREGDTSPIDLITRRYAGIVILKPCTVCPQICVYCQRNWEIGDLGRARGVAKPEPLRAAITWIAEHPTIHEVLVTGGDPLILPDARLKAILDQLAAVPHVERIRLGTRTPVTLPMRLTPALCDLLGAYRVPGRREICIITHVEHCYEVTPELMAAVERLRLRGVPVYNQLVYTFYVSRRFEAAALRRLLRRCGIDPYYTFNTKGKAETAAYRVPIARLLQEQKEEARLLPGLARTDEPVYNVPGLGKNHLNSWQHRDLVSVRPDGARVYEFHPWEKKIAPQRTYLADDVPILDYLERLSRIGEDPQDYETIWYYF